MLPYSGGIMAGLVAALLVATAAPPFAGAAPRMVVTEEFTATW